MILAPNQYERVLGDVTVFLAGGYTIPDWRSEFVRQFEEKDDSVIFLNPVWTHVRPGDPTYKTAKITWDYAHLRKADAVLFWFPQSTNMQMPWFELGSFTVAKKPLYVGVHPKYQRRDEVVTQLRLARPDVFVTESLELLVNQLRDSLESSGRVAHGV